MGTRCFHSATATVNKKDLLSSLVILFIYLFYHHCRSLACDSPPNITCQEPFPIPPPQTEPWYPAIPQDPAGEVDQAPNSSPKCFTFRRHTRILESFEVTTNFDANWKSWKAFWSLNIMDWNVFLQENMFCSLAFCCKNTWTVKYSARFSLYRELTKNYCKSKGTSKIVPFTLQTSLHITEDLTLLLQSSVTIFAGCVRELPSHLLPSFSFKWSGVVFVKFSNMSRPEIRVVFGGFFFPCSHWVVC